MGRSYNLDDILTQREEILKAALFMFLHDIGKLQPGHQAKFIRGYKPPHYATRFSHYKHILEHPSLNPIVWQVSLPGQTGASLANIITKHHGANETNDGLWIVLSQRIDRLDSKWDRDEIISEGVQPIREFIPITSPFGWAFWAYRRVEDSSNLECKPQSPPWPLYYAGPTQFSEQRKDCLDRLFRCLIQSVQISNRNPCLEALRKPHRIALRLITTKACGDTRFSVNDITLWDHSISTAILFKILASWSILTTPDLTDNRQFPRSNDERFTRWFRPQLLPLRIDGLAYLAQSNDIPDLLARRAWLTQIYDALQDILEWEFPLAGEVYRDENGPVFLTFLRDENGQDPIPLSALQLPKDSNDTHVLREAYLRASQTPKQSLEDYLRQAVVELSQGDLTLPPEIPLFTYTQKSTKAAGEKSLGDLLADEQKQGLWLQAHAKTLQDAWQDTKEICSVCGLRPLGFGAEDDNNREKAISRKMCGVCLERRVDRAKTWAQGVHKSSQKRFWNSRPETVWLDEVADANGRLALIVGYFPLEHWLDGTLVESLAMFKRSSAASGATNHKVQVTDEKGETHEVVLGPKPISYSRLRRVWETTRRFWQDVAPTDAPPQELRDFCNSNGLNLEDLWEGPLSLEDSVAGKVIGQAGPRLEILGIPEGVQGELGKYHAYELRFPQGVKMAVVWDPEARRLITAENLVYIAALLGWQIPSRQKNESEQDYRTRLHQEAAHFVQRKLTEVSAVTLEEPSHYGGRAQVLGTFSIADGNVSIIENSTYTPLIPILAEPRTFMALVPADKALEVVRAIKAKYEREMGKVRNRLPLHLGIVFADAHQPLRTILDAGRRMLRSEFAHGRISGWMVCPETFPEGPDSWATLRPTKQVPKQDRQALRHLIAEPRSLKKQTKQFDKWRRIVLKRWDRCFEETITWYVPAVMGDGVTQDWWYPFAFLEQEDEPSDRNLYYKATNPWNENHPWLVHVSKLRPGDVIYFTPATFDFIWLDHGGTRFEIAYDQCGRRRGTLRRPYLLDELDDLVACWEMLAGDREKGIKRLSTSQLHAVRDLIETKRAEWFQNPQDSLQDVTFRRHCESVLKNAQWATKPTKDEMARLTHWAVTGLLADAVELFYHIMKQRPVGEEKT